MNSEDKRLFIKPIKAIAAFVLAWIVPGAGHAFVGRPGRGIIIFIVIGATFWGGVAMGGVMTVDHEGQKWWFAAEMLTGVHGLVGWQRESKQIEMLDGQIQEGMEQKRISLEQSIKRSERELKDYNRRVAQLEQDVATATDQQRKAYQSDLDQCREIRDGIESQWANNHSELRSLRSSNIEEVLIEEKLALVAPMATVARAYAGVAGLLNLMCMFDVAMIALIGSAVTGARANKPEDDEQ